MSWQHGRELASMHGNGNELEFAYDHNGIRISKLANCVEHKYTLDNANILRETYGDTVLDFIYGADNTVCGFRYNGNYYSYRKNLQSDIVAIYTATGTLKAKYSYDAWGKCTVVTDIDGIGTLNPFRYRGYYYDTETELYYLQSRYYDPEVGRFINADDAEVASFDSDILIQNLFLYCRNDPVNETDYNGNIFMTICRKILSGLLIGFLKPLIKDVVLWSIRKYLLKKDVEFELSKYEDYINSIITEIIDNVATVNSVGWLFHLIGFLIQYVPKFIRGDMEKSDWINLVIDVVALIIDAFLSESLDNLNDEIAKVRKEKNKNRQKGYSNTEFKKQISNLNVKIKVKGVSLNLVLPISQEVLNFIFNIIFG